MKKENIKILDKLNELIDKEAESAIVDNSLIKGCLSYMICGDCRIYCQASAPQFLDYRNQFKDYNIGSVPMILPSGVEIYNPILLESYDIFTQTMGGDTYLSLSTYPFFRLDEDKKPYCYIEVSLKTILEDISFKRLKVSGLTIESNKSAYFMDENRINELLDNFDSLAIQFVHQERPRIAVYKNNILNPLLYGMNRLKITTDRKYSGSGTATIDLDNDDEIIKHYLISILNNSKKNEGPQFVEIQISCSKIYEDTVAKMIKTVHEYLKYNDDYYERISFLTEDEYYYGYIKALINAYCEGMNWNDFLSCEVNFDRLELVN